MTIASSLDHPLTSEAPEPLFEVRDVHKRFGHQVVLERIDLGFESGRLSGIIGPNGAGKTTLFNVLTGEYRPDRGQVLYKGSDITGRSPHQIARLGIARSFQTMNLFDEYTALENVVVALPEVRDRGYNMVHDVPLDEGLRNRGLDQLDRVGIRADAHVLARELPYGKRRALDIGVALASRPDILFLDEPTQGLGTSQVDLLADLVTSLKDAVTMVIIEHDMGFLFRLADTIAVVHWGQVIARGTPAELMQNRWVTASSLGTIQGADES
jgi:branched-chain amino acid transport system ATP-binding protein